VDEVEDEEAMVTSGRLSQAVNAAWQRIAQQEHWTQGIGARDRGGNHVRTTDSSAVAWCAVGALERIAGEDDELFERGLEVLCRASRAVTNCDDPARVNDTLGHEAVERIYARALDMLREERRPGTGFSSGRSHSIRPGPLTSAKKRMEPPAVVSAPSLPSV
jgi:hypothetical protein